eukprot:NODE_4466_length_672_cov_1.168558.p3 GENE.NODE_4466_length_672_cov_1.168558~~NODE_4466_length_672_cov_1.168558.p3  ORF type:complete len:78 (+),score=17.84 NODE_4466_length_672_cov_1.168558:363-596(+)
MPIVRGITPTSGVPADDAIEDARFAILVLTHDGDRQLKVLAKPAKHLLNNAGGASEHQIITMEEVGNITGAVIREAG